MEVSLSILLRVGSFFYVFLKAYILHSVHLRAKGLSQFFQRLEMSFVALRTGGPPFYPLEDRAFLDSRIPKVENTPSFFSKAGDFPPLAFFF